MNLLIILVPTSEADLNANGRDERARLHTEIWGGSWGGGFGGVGLNHNPFRNVLT